MIEFNKKYKRNCKKEQKQLSVTLNNISAHSLSLFFDNNHRGDSGKYLEKILFANKKNKL